MTLFESDYDTDQDLSAEETVYRIIASIPFGRVTTYGTIAALGAIPGGARRVGWILARVPEERDLPCHRVVNARGELSGGWAFGHPMIMRQLLEEEQIEFVGEYRVDMKRHFWPDENQPPPTT